MITYAIILVLLLVAELVYFKIAYKFNIIDKPNERSSHSTIVLRGGGIIFLIAALVWAAIASFNGFQEVSGSEFQVSGGQVFLPFIIGLVLVAGVSFVDDIISLPDGLRLVVQFASYGLMFWSLGLFEAFQVSDGFSVSGVILPALIVLVALIVCVGATNIYNFMDGINGITAGYSLAVLVPLALLNSRFQVSGSEFQVSGSEFQVVSGGFVPESLLVVMTLAVVVFSIFNFRPKGKAKCFAGDVGSIGIAFVLLFCIGRLILLTQDITWLIFMLVYGIDGVLTICHRIMLHENLGEAHRKHAFQLMANELKIGHVPVTLIYMAMQLVVSLGFIYLCPNTIACHWMYLIGAIIILSAAYVLFKKKYYHLHEEYLASLK